MFMVRGDSPYRQHRDLKGKPTPEGASGSGLSSVARRYVFDGLGLDITRTFAPIYSAVARATGRERWCSTAAPRRNGRP